MQWGKRENEILLELSFVLSRIAERQIDLKCELLQLLDYGSIQKLPICKGKTLDRKKNMTI